ncbi:MAG: type II toxin-antitoxin system HipA family toxin [Roseburia sp.]|nr:type II toxin-antitoxin system HipA family toxin [Roseburia sp.]MCM1243924.1 type II toxin-antitoxin system HipA family toxin [Roseburia sp.]
MAAHERIFVYENWRDTAPEKIGTLYVDGARGREVISFEYSENWLANATENFIFDPELSLFKGRQYTPLDKTMFGVFADSCPDRWGRLLIKRREAILAKKEGRKPRHLSDDRDLSAPPWTTLRKLESASLAFEKNDDGMEEKWLKQLLAPGSSLGGARPKASVTAPDGSLWIAKFPSLYDDVNIGAWEMVIHDLAVMCGLNVPEARLEKFSRKGSTFLVKRFDREEKRRIHFISAMTLLGKKDGAGAADGSSYLDIASSIRKYGASPKRDLRELWCRIVFNMAVSNTDDHLRNHGFLLSGEGWELSPLYDVNPNAAGDALSLNVDEDNSLIDFGLALSVARLYDLSERQALEELNRIKNVVETNWRKSAGQYGVSRGEIEGMSPAFDMRFKS